MILYGDYHTHTPYSHGKGTILENALMAKQKGLKEIAITDHGFNHKLYGMKRADLAQMRKEIEVAKQKTGVNILLGVEANFIDSNGNVDITEDDLDKLDILLVGYHKFVTSTSAKEQARFLLTNNSVVLRNLDSTIQRNTIAILKALDKYPISVITHLGAGMPVNSVEIAKYARDKGTLIELNGKRITFTKDEIQQMVKENVKFIINSDAHSAERVGETNKGLNLMIKYNIPPELVVNLNNKPLFRFDKKIQE